MVRQATTIGLAIAVAFVASTALADHNSKNGEGTANMPNDIHNTRVDTIESGDQEAFKDFVKNGAGSETINRFNSDDTTAQRASNQEGKAEEVKAMSKNMDGNRNVKQVREERRARPEPGAASMSRQSAGMREERMQRAERSGGNARQRDRGAGKRR